MLSKVHPINPPKAFSLSLTIYWIKKSGFTVLDQGLSSGANFLTDILLARWLEPAQYGAFAVAFSVFLLLGVFHTAVLTEPMMVFGAGKYREKFPKYLGVLIYGHWVITGAITLILATVSVIFWRLGHQSTVQALVGLTIASPLILHFGLVRRGFYTQLRTQWAAAGSAIYLVCTLGFILGLRKIGLLSPGSALIAMGFAGLVSSVVSLLILRPQLRFKGTNPTPAMILTDHWKYGSWNVLAQGVYWSSGQILMVLVPIFLGLQASAVIAAVLNLFKPLNLLFPSTSLMIIPIFSAQMSKGINTNSLMNQTKWFVLLFAAGVFIYGILIFAFASPILHHLYRGRYDGYSTLVFLFALSYTASATVHVLTTILRSVGKVRETVFIWGISALITLLLSVPILLLARLHGVIILFTCSYLIAAIAAWRQFCKYKYTNR
jgi:O-antigen/teichoic acid export membrane protein